MVLAPNNLNWFYLLKFQDMYSYCFVLQGDSNENKIWKQVTLFRLSYSLLIFYISPRPSIQAYHILSNPTAYHEQI